MGWGEASLLGRFGDAFGICQKAKLHTWVSGLLAQVVTSQSSVASAQSLTPTPANTDFRTNTNRFVKVFPIMHTGPKLLSLATMCGTPCAEHSFLSATNACFT